MVKVDRYSFDLFDCLGSDDDDDENDDDDDVVVVIVQRRGTCRN